MKKIPTKIDNIKKMWTEELNNDGAKTSFIELCAKEFGKSARTLRQWWFSNNGYWSVPEKYQDRVIKLLQNTISLQNEKK